MISLIFQLIKLRGVIIMTTEERKPLNVKSVSLILDLLLEKIRELKEQDEEGKE